MADGAGGRTDARMRSMSSKGSSSIANSRKRGNSEGWEESKVNLHLLVLILSHALTLALYELLPMLLDFPPVL